MKINKKVFALLPLFIFGLIFLLNILTNRNEAKGALLYRNNCANCHMDQGEGLRGLIPPLAKADYLQKYQGDLACIIRYGMKGEIVVNGQSYNQAMPGNAELSDIEITNLINYINRQWGNEIPERSVQQVRKDLAACE